VVNTVLTRSSTVTARLRGRMLPILQTAVAAVVAWYLSSALVPDPRPAFASIAAVIAIGATYGQRSQRAVQLTGGVVIGITAADLLNHVIGTGAPQMGLMVVLAMSAAVLIGGGELVVVEAAVSAILLVSLDPATGDGFSPNRIVEALIGGASALGISFMFFPPDPALGVGRATQAVFAELGRTLERIAHGLAERDTDVAEAALTEARAIDRLVLEAHDALATSRETARLAPPRRAVREQLGRYERSMPHLDYAVRNTRMVARHALRVTRGDDAIAPALPEAIRELVSAIWELAGAYDDPPRAARARRLAVGGAARATELYARGEEPALTELLGQIRSTAVDLVRGADVLADTPPAAYEQPTEELLVPAT
jgi:uncharacterized membrane protein YgaE (UPF0421/DUF939 family)